MLVGLSLISAALLLICGMVALEVALLESRRAFIPQSGGYVEPSEGRSLREGTEAENSVSVTDYLAASRLLTTVLLLLVGGLVIYVTKAHGPLAAIGASNTPEISFTSVLVLALGAGVFVTAAVVLCYILPHFLGTRFRDGIVKALSPVGRFIVRLMWPAVATSRLMRHLGARRDGGAVVEEEAIEEDIRSLVKEGERAGVIEEEEREMITRVFRLGDKPIASLMTPRSDVVFLDIGMTVGQSVQAALESRLTWFPVRQGIDDEVIGIVSVHDVLQLQVEQTAGDGADLKAMLAPAMDVPESMTALELLERFKESGEHFAVVRDEYGSVAGIATVDDVLQVVVGDIGEANGEERSITVRDDGTLLVDASLDIQNLFEELGVSESSEGDHGQFHSVGGFVMTSLGRIPKAGDSFMHDGHRFEVVDMDGKRIDKVLVARVVGQRAVGG